MTAPILQKANLSRPYILRTDASSYALGAVLLQGDENEERPIKYASRLLISRKRNYSTSRRKPLQSFGPQISSVVIWNEIQ